MLALQEATSLLPESLRILFEDGSLSGRIVLVLLTIFSIISWIMIVWKWAQFRTLRKDGYRFVSAIERSQKLEDAYRTAMRLPETPYTRVFRQGATFFNELRPGALHEGAAPQAGLTETQLHALWLVLEKVQDEERDAASGGLVWLAIIAVVSPLLGLLGTVLGIMTTFRGIVAMQSANITAVAPGIAMALMTTAFGLVAAIPAAVAYNYFVTRLDRFSGELDGFASEFVGTLAREGRL